MYKILSVLFYILFFSNYIFAQIPKGTKVIGGNAGMIHAENKADIASVNLIQSSAGSANVTTSLYGLVTGEYFVKQNVALGLEVKFQYNGVDDSGYGFSPYLKKYYRLTDRWYIYGAAAVAYFHDFARGHTVVVLRNPSGGYEDYLATDYGNSTTWSGQLSTGIDYFISQKVSIGAKVVSFSMGRTKTIDKLSDQGRHDNIYFHSSKSNYTMGIGLPPINLTLKIFFRK